MHIHIYTHTYTHARLTTAHQRTMAVDHHVFMNDAPQKCIYTYTHTYIHARLIRRPLTDTMAVDHHVLVDDALSKRPPPHIHAADGLQVAQLCVLYIYIYIYIYAAHD